MENADISIFYDKEYDDLRRSGLDVIKNGEPPKDVHFSRAFPDGIPAEIWEKMKAVIDSGGTL